MRSWATQRVAFAARLHFAAVGVEDSHRRVGAIGAAPDHNHLIAADAEPPVRDRFRRRFIEHNAAVSRVENREIIAQSVHFEKGGHCRRI